MGGRMKCGGPPSSSGTTTGGGDAGDAVRLLWCSADAANSLVTSRALATGAARPLIGSLSVVGGNCGWSLEYLVGWGQHFQAPPRGPKNEIFVEMYNSFVCRETWDY